MAKGVSEQPVLRIATINLLNFIEPPLACYESDNIYSHSQWQAKCAWLTRCLQQLQPDVVGFQEVFSPQTLAKLIEPLGFDWLQWVEEPRLQDEYIYQRPVNAIASRHPIMASGALTADKTVSELLGINPNFQFSRAPVWCRIAMPLMGLCDIYCVHFKSKRSAIDTLVWPLSDDGVQLQTMSRRLGRASSNLIRGAEAEVLMHHIIANRHQQQLPVVLMGDFNDQLDSSVLDILHVDEDMNRYAGQSGVQLEPGLDEYGLRDSFNLYKLHVTDAERLPTHYWRGRGSVLDYILLSSEFDPRSRASTMDVTDFKVFDQHMFGPESTLESESSDHAAVMVTLSPRA